MSNSNPNEMKVIPHTPPPSMPGGKITVSIWVILIILAVLLSGAALFFALRHCPPVAHHGCCCCCGGGGGMNSASGNMPSLGGSRSGNPTTTIMSQPGVNGGQPKIINIHIDPSLGQPNTPTVIGINLVSPAYPSYSLVLTGTGVPNGGSITLSANQQYQFHYVLTPAVDWKINVVTPGDPASNVSNSTGEYTSSYSTTYNFMSDPSTPASAIVYVNSN